MSAGSTERPNHRHQRVESRDCLHARRLRVYAWRNVDIGSIRSQSIDCVRTSDVTQSNPAGGGGGSVQITAENKPDFVNYCKSFVFHLQQTATLQ